MSDTEEIAVTGASDGTIAIWDISNGARLVNTITGPGNQLVLFFIYSSILFALLLC